MMFGCFAGASAERSGVVASRANTRAQRRVAVMVSSASGGGRCVAVTIRRPVAEAIIRRSGDVTASAGFLIGRLEIDGHEQIAAQSQRQRGQGGAEGEGSSPQVDL